MYVVLSSICTKSRFSNEMFQSGCEMRNGNIENKAGDVLLSLLLDALLFVAARIQVKGEVGPLVAWWKGDGLAQSETHGVDDAFASGL